MEERYEQDDLRQAVATLKAGGIILYPTDTVWGIGCDATCSEAVKRIFRLKRREDSKSMLMLLEGEGKLQGYVDVPEAAAQLLDVTRDGGTRPMTLIYPRARNIAPELIAEDGSVGIRITREPFTSAICRALHHPLVSTSANISGEPTAKNFEQITVPIREGVDYICRYRREDKTEHQPSSIIQINMYNTFRIIR